MFARRLGTLGVIAFLPLIPVLLFGYVGHDLPFHLGTWFDLRANWSAGTLLPGWAAHANHTLGDPRFCYYPPLSYWVGGILSLLLPMRWVVGAYIWLALFLSGVTMYFASREFVGPGDRMTAAILYVLSPYLLVTAVVRFAAAELLVLAWLPLVFACFARSQLSARPLEGWRWSVWLGLLLGLSWLTNLPASIVIAYIFAASSGVIAWRTRSLVPLTRYGAAEAIGIGLAAVHLVPAFIDKKWIRSSSLLAFDFRRNFLIVPHPFLAFLAFCVLAAWVGAALVLVAWRSKEVRAERPLMLLLLVGALAFVFEMPISYPLWRYLPELAFAQFPFRFLSFTGLVTATLLAGVPGWRRLRPLTFAAVGFLALSLGVGQQVWNLHVHGLPPPFAQTWGQIANGYDGPPEYVPAGASATTWTEAEQRGAALARALDPATESICTVHVRTWNPSARVLETAAQAPCRIRLATFYFPYWRARTSDGAFVETSRGEDGWLVVDVPAGPQVISLAFDPETSTRTIARLVSLGFAIAAVALLIWFARARRGWRVGAAAA